MDTEQLKNMSLQGLVDSLSDEEKFAQAMSDAGRDNFVNAYRDALDRQKDLTFQNLEQTRRNTQQNIMGAANSYGMMYSNFPERAKIQYDTSTYMPAKTKAQTTYQTGLDTLRNNVTSYLNKIADYNDEIASLNKRSASNTSNLPTGATLLNDAGDYRIRSIRGTNFYNSKNEPIRFGTVLRRNNITDAEQIINAAEAALDEDAAKRLYNLYKDAYERGYGNFAINAGDNFAPNSLDFLSEADRDFMDSLGLTFTQ